MATVRKRKLPSGLIRWQAGYVDGAGERRFKAFNRKADADAWLIETRHDVARGLHTPGSISPTVSRRTVDQAVQRETSRAHNREGLRRTRRFAYPAVHWR
jgi:hypothetical protein